ncbi:MAG: hypothetical protein Q8K32_23845 [Archangium sp.]|nr:hypothetical protein [Archangium sp.]
MSSITIASNSGRPPVVTRSFSRKVRWPVDSPCGAYIRRIDSPLNSNPTGTRAARSSRSNFALGS